MTESNKNIFKNDHKNLDLISVDEEERVSKIVAYIDENGIEQFAPFMNAVPQTSRYRETNPDDDYGPHYSQTLLPTQEELNADVALEREKRQLALLTAAPYFPKVRKNKSKVMLIRPRNTKFKHIPYWNVEKYLIQGASTACHPGCIDYLSLILNWASNYIHDAGKFPTIQKVHSIQTTESRVLNGHNRIDHMCMSDCLCAIGFMYTMHEACMYEHNRKLGEYRINILKPIKVEIDYYFAHLPFRLHSPYPLLKTPECIEAYRIENYHIYEVFLMFYEFVQCSIIKGSFSEGLELFRSTIAILSRPPCVWIKAPESLEIDEGGSYHRLGYYFQKRTYSIFAWAKFLVLIHNGIDSQYFKSFHEMFNNCRMNVSMSRAVKAMMQARKTYFVHKEYKDKKYSPKRFFLDEFPYEISDIVQHPLFRPFYIFTKTSLNIFNIHLKQIGFSNRQRVYIGYNDLIEGASRLWNIIAPHVCPHGCRKRNSPCKPLPSFYSDGMCLNHGEIFENEEDQTCRIYSDCEDCPTKQEELRYFLDHLTQEEAEPTNEPEVEEKPSFWKKYFDWTSASVDETLPYPEEGNEGKASFSWLNECFVAFKDSLLEFIKKEFSSFYDTIKSLIQGLWDTVKTPFKAISDCLNDIASPFVKILKSMLRILGLDKYVQGRNLAVDIYAVLIGIFTYQYVENPIFRVLVCIFFLFRFNVVKNVHNFVTFFKNNLFNYTVPEIEDAVEPTSSMFDFITVLSTSMGMNLAVKIAMGAIFVTTGIAATSVHKATLCRILVDMAKNLHFIGAGMQGVVKIWQYLSDGIPKLMAAVRKMMSIENDEDKARKLQEEAKIQFTNKLFQFFTFCKAFDTEEGYSVIRRSSEAQARVRQWYDFYVTSQRFKVDPTYSDVFVSSVNQEFSVAQRSFQKLFDLVVRVTKYGDFRETPFHIQFVGQPGVGKSTLLSLVTKTIKERYFPSESDNHLVFTRGDTEYFDGYSNQPIMIQDDIWSTNDYKKVSEILPLVSNTPLVIPMAHLADKATFFDSKFILSTTNTAFPYTTAIWCNQAIWRRRHILCQIEIDPDVYNPTTSKFEKNLFDKKYPGADISALPHLKFNIMQPVPQDNATPQLIPEQYKDETLPSGLSKPLINLDFKTFMSKTFNRYDAMRGEERMLRPASEQDYSSYLAISDLLNELAESDPSAMTEIAKRFIQVPPIKDDSSGEFDKEDVNSVLSEGEIKIITEDVQVHQVDESPFDDQPTNDLDYSEFEKAERKYLDDYPLKTSNPSIAQMLDGRASDFTIQDYKDAIADEDITMGEKRVIEAKLAEYCGILNEHTIRRKYRGRINKILSDSLSQVEKVDDAPPCMGEWSVYNKLSFREIVQSRNYVTMNKKRNYFYGKPMYDIQPVKGGVDEVYRISQDYPETSAAEFASKVKPSNWKNSIYDAAIFFPSTVNIECFKSYISKHNYPEYLSNMIEFNTALIKQLNNEFLQGIKKYKFNHYYVKGTIGLHEWYDGTLKDLSVEKKKEITKMAERLRARIHYDEVEDWAYIMPYKKAKMMRTEAAAAKDEMLRQIPVDRVAKMDPTYKHPAQSFYENTVELGIYARQRRVIGSQTEIHYNKKFYNQVNIFANLQPEVQQALVDFSQGKDLHILNVLNCSIKDAAKYYSVKFHNLIFNKISSCMGMVGLGDLCATFFIIIYAGIVFYALKNTFKAMFGIKEAEPTSRVLFKAAAPAHLRSKIAVPTNSICIENITNKIRRNLIQVHIPGLGQANALGLDGQNLLVNTHFIQKKVEAGTIFELFFIPTLNSEDQWSCFINPKTDIKILPDTDAAIISSMHFRFFSKIIHLFVKQEDVAKYEVPDDIMNIYLKNNKEFLSSFQCYGVHDSYKVNFLNNSIRNAMAYYAPKVAGSSGGVVYALNNYTQRPIYGIQSCANSECSYAALLTQELLYANISTRITHQGPVTEIISDTTPTSSLIDEHLVCVGKIDTKVVQGIVRKTSFLPTIFSKEFQTQSIPAILSAFDSRVSVGDHPLRHSINKFGRDIVRPIHPYIIQRAVNDISDYFKGQLAGKQLKILSLEDSITGLPEPGYGSVDLTTSPGIPWIFNKSERGKRTWIDLREDGSVNFIHPDLRKAFTEGNQLLQKGIIPANSMYEFPKDELRPIGKALGPPIKTRSISVMDFNLTLLFRRYCLSFEAFLHTKADGNNPCCVGINPTSIAWANMYSKLMNVNTHGNDLDVGNWDGHFPSQLWLAVCDVFNNVYDDGEVNKLVRQCLFLNACFGFTNFLDLSLQKNRGMPSGFPGTAPTNTIGHFLLFYCVYLMICQEFKITPSFTIFITEIAAFFYGDDLIYSISRALQAQGITSLAISEKYKYFGWPISSASKLQSLLEDKPISELQFLKRKFVKDPMFGSYVIYGAIDPCVINDLLHWQRQTANNKQQMYINIYNALEFAYAHGEDYYNEILNKINKILQRHRKVPIIQSYDEVREIVLSRYFNP